MTTLDQDKAELIKKAIEVAVSRRGTGGPPHEQADTLLRAYYRHVAPEDVCDRSEVDVYGALASHWKLGLARPQGTAQVRVFTPTLAEHGWSASGHSVVEVAVDDMPFLVDSLTMELSRQLRDVHVVIHPLLDVERDITGALQRVRPVEDGSLEPPAGFVRESWMHVEIDRIREDDDTTAIEDDIQRVLRDVRESVEDWDKMHAQVDAIVADLQSDPPPLDPEELRQGRELLEWLADEHFTFLGYREYRLERKGDDELLRAVPGTGLGILRADQDMSASFGKLPAMVKAKAREKTLLVLAKANSRSTVHRPAYLDYVGVKTFENGEVVGERRFLGLYSSAAYTESLTRIPLLAEKAAAVLKRLGFDLRSHAGKALMDTLETYPRDELFHTTVDELAPMAEAAMHARERRQLRMFIRRDTYGRYVSVLVYLPRDRYNTSVRERFSQILKDRLGGESVEFNVMLGASTTARVHFVVHPPKGGTVLEVEDTDDLERRLTDASRSWRDDFVQAVIAEYGEEVGATLGRRYLDCFPEAYKEDFDARTAAVDLGRLEALQGEEGIDLSLYEQMDAGRGEARLKVYRIGSPLSLSQILPMLSSMGVEVVDERPYELEGLARPTYVYEFGLRYGTALPAHARELFQDALRAVWDGFNEIDGFNALVLAAGLTWRQATVLRAYAKYMRQGNSPFALDYIEGALRGNVDITRLLVQLFEARFQPGNNGLGARSEARLARIEALEERIGRALGDVASLDHDRILRSYLTHIKATLRTNYFLPLEDHDGGGPRTYMSFKLEPSAIPDLPEPRPRFEIFVYSPRVEGVHLRFGAVARGGLRWSDRRDDFRTEVLGLVKAQMVKNTVIVPVGAKGGFFCKQLPPASDRDAWLAEGIACYRTFICGLLDITDNLVDGETVPPRHVVRHDGDDSYLVVAADKGTATFSDIANKVAQDYGFWLGDAFASGGSVGYDHKAMGITAKGAWVSVQRHFRERGIDCQAEDFTAVGIGDMSGDVFGNGMLCSEHTRLVAAFDHRDIFVDPSPDAATSYAERRRLFDLPRSSWQDYDRSLISAGGGIWPRSLKSIPVGPEMREALGLAAEVTAMTPAELMKAILQAPVDLLWNGGIGTYVKAADETHADAGDKSNDPIRVNGRDLRVKCVGEGGNLGFTQLGRIEYAQLGADGRGGRMNTDFIDNSAGVDTSDHEVNIKILLDRVVKDGDLTEKQRNALLAEMTDEVGELVLRDNYEQNLALANAAAHAPSLLHVHEDWMRRLERKGVLNRELEGLPSTRQVKRRLERGEGLTTPELSVLLSWTKIVLADELLSTDLPADAYLDVDLRAYFPSGMRERFEPQIHQHQLRREIIVTQVVNDLVNGAGMTFWPRLEGETGATAAELTRANFVAREIFGSLPLREELNTYDNVLDAAVQTRMRLEMRTLVERASRWLVTNRRPPLDSQAAVEFFSGRVQAVMEQLPELATGRELAALQSRRDALVAQGVPEPLATRVAVLPPAYVLLGLVEIAEREGIDPAEVARVHFALGERLGLSALTQRILALPREDRWQTMARAALRDDLNAVHAQLTAQVLRTTSSEESAPARIAAWEDQDSVVVPRAAGTLEEICVDEAADLARLSVGLRVVRGLLATG
ncbi:NAD-glutamate dehydrogenase [Nocardioides panaciterrulae]|nr:NAD-glutamate dehydrogenase [Nocardioides panaciterrulae]